MHAHTHACTHTRIQGLLPQALDHTDLGWRPPSISYYPCDTGHIINLAEPHFPVFEMVITALPHKVFLQFYKQYR